MFTYVPITYIAENKVVWFSSIVVNIIGKKKVVHTHDDMKMIIDSCLVFGTDMTRRKTI